jgi:hypothetical protein
MGGVAREIETACIGGDIVTIVEVEVKQRMRRCSVPANCGNRENNE